MIATVGVVVLFATMATSCSNAPETTTTDTTAVGNVPGSGVSADVTSSASGADATATTTARDLGVKFAECMRAHDVPDFPDPNAKGEFEFGVNVSAEVWTAAVEACKDLQPPGSLSSTRSPEQQSAGLVFAQCIRDNGVADFPDPVQGEPLIDTYRIPSTDRAGGMDALNAAIALCRDQLDAAATGQ